MPTGDEALTIVNEATRHATVTTGCGQTPPTVTVGNASNLEGLAVNPATDTIYVVNTGDDTISVINGATCNGTNTSGCGRPPGSLAQRIAEVCLLPTRIVLSYLTNLA